MPSSPPWRAAPHRSPAPKLMFEILRKMQSDLAAQTQRMERLEGHLGNFEKRQTAAMHFEQSVLSHLAGIHEGMDELKAEMRVVRREVHDMADRLAVVERR